MPQPKYKAWIIVAMDGGEVLESIERAGVALGQARHRGAPNLFKGCLIPEQAIALVNEYFETGELLYGPE